MTRIDIMRCRRICQVKTLITNRNYIAEKFRHATTAPTRNEERSPTIRDCPVLFISVVEFLVIDGKRQQGRRLFCNFSVVRSVPNVLTIAKYRFE